MTTAAPAKPAISTFERYLSVWVALCIVVGIALGYALPGPFANRLQGLHPWSAW